jgi:hypothetical protein
MLVRKRTNPELRATSYPNFERPGTICNRHKFAFGQNPLFRALPSPHRMALTSVLAAAIQSGRLFGMRSQTIASKLFAWRVAPLAVLCAGLCACGGSSPPAEAPTNENLGTTAGPTAPPPPPSLAGDVQADQKKNKFDEEQAKIVLARAATNAHSCVEVVDKDQPHGEGTVTVTFSGKGKSTNATIAAPFEGTPIGDCAKRAFVNIIVPPFEGADIDMTYQINLKPDAKGAKKDSAKPKK